MNLRGGLTAHCMVRNEPFVTYAVRSVYDWVDRVLLYDTGSDDAHTLNDVAQLVVDDAANQKITFERVELEVDETKWTNGAGPRNYRRMARDNRGKRGKWWCRRKMIHDTETEYFMVLDGDEVHYAANMAAIRQCLLSWPAGKVCGFVPLVWFKDPTRTFHRSRSGRVFKTDAVGMSTSSPSEIHVDLKTGKKIGPNSSCTFSVPGAVPYAHFEAMLKPWRRNVHPSKLQEFTAALPEVMVEDPSYVRRFLDGPK